MLWQLPFGKRPDPWPPVPSDVSGDQTALADRFAEANRVVLPEFERCDGAAFAGQRRHRRYQLLMVIAAMATGIMGAVQAALADDRWPGVVVAVLGLAATAIATRQRDERTGEKYLGERAKAEALRALYFRHLAAVDDANERQLEEQVAAIAFPLPTQEAT